VSGWLVLMIERGRVARAVFPPQQVAQVKAIACELPREAGVPLSRFSRAELHRLVIERAVCEASASTIARWLSEDAIRAVAAPLVDLPARPALLGEGRPGARSLPAPLAGRTAAPWRPGDLRR
jgi:hypothetical protein